MFVTKKLNLKRSTIMKESAPLLFVIPSKNNKDIDTLEIEATDNNQESDILSDKIESTLLADYQIPVEDINLLQQLGFSGNDVQVYEDKNLSTKENYINYILKGDIEIKANNLINRAVL